jgi:DNA polymerase I-like protein with 3'-5' exonuclease and polymerase domains
MSTPQFAKEKVDRKAAYQPAWRAVPKDPAYPKGYNCILVESIEQLQQIHQSYLETPKESRVLGFDTETTGLSPTKDHIVGFSLSFQKETGYYVPLRHVIGAECNLAIEQAWPILIDFLLESRLVVGANIRFDGRMIECDPQHPTPVRDRVKWFDIIQLMWLMDTNVKQIGLKDAMRAFLGWEPEKYESVATNDDKSFAFVHPRDGVNYASFDAIAPLRLMQSPMARLIATHKFIVELDQECILPVWLMEDTSIPFNRVSLSRIERETIEELETLEAEIFKTMGVVFTITSPKQLSDALASVGLNTGTNTATGMSTKIDLLEKLEGQHPAIPLLIRYKELHKSLTSYISTLLRETQRTGSCRFQYHTARVPTGRFACGTGDGTYFAGINVQSVPKPRPATYVARQVKDDGSGKPLHEQHPDSILGWEFAPLPKGMTPPGPDSGYLIVEGFDQKANLRSAFLPFSPDHYWVSVDFSAQELRIPANVAGEISIIRAFLEGKDPHKVTAIDMFGEAAYNKEKRGIAKALNFGALYGGNKFTIAEASGKSPEEAEEYLRKWWKSRPRTTAWIKQSYAFARKFGYIQTVFGRPRYVRHWYQSASRKDNSFADRTVVNTQVQGAAADMLRIAFVGLYRHLLKNPDYHEHFKLLLTVHDEIDFSISKSKFVELIPKIKNIMEIKVPTWKVPMETSVEIGSSWGCTFAFIQDSQGVWVPKRA